NVVVDRNGDRRLDHESIIAIPPATRDGPGRSPRIVVRHGRERLALRLFSDARGRLTWRLDDVWQALLQIGDERLSVRVVRLGVESWLALSDPSNVGSHRSEVSFKTPLPLGGYGWQVSVEGARQRLVLTRTSETPVSPGFPAPEMSL